TGRVLDSRADRWDLFVRNIGTIVFGRVKLRFRMSADLSTAEGEMGAVFTDCGMSRAYLPQLGSGTFLDLVLSQGKQADIDIDGDPVPRWHRQRRRRADRLPGLEMRGTARLLHDSGDRAHRRFRARRVLETGVRQRVVPGLAGSLAGMGLATPRGLRGRVRVGQ